MTFWWIINSSYTQEKDFQIPTYAKITHSWFGEGSVELKKAISMSDSGTMTGGRYRDDILNVNARSYIPAIGTDFILMHDNARPHCATVVDAHFEQDTIVCMEWPAETWTLSNTCRCGSSPPLDALPFRQLYSNSAILFLKSVSIFLWQPSTYWEHATTVPGCDRIRWITYTLLRVVFVLQWICFHDIFTLQFWWDTHFDGWSDWLLVTCCLLPLCGTRQQTFVHS